MFDFFLVLQRQAAEIKRRGKKKAAESPRESAVVETQQKVPLEKPLQRDESLQDISEDADDSQVELREEDLKSLDSGVPDFVKDSTSSIPSVSSMPHSWPLNGAICF